MDTTDRRVLNEARDALAIDWPERFNIARACCDDWAEADPERTALIHVADSGEAERWSFARLKDASDRLAGVLAGMGVEEGDRVALMLSQCPETLIAHFAAMKLGAVSLPLFTLFGPDSLSYRLSDSGAKIVITDAGDLSKILGISDDLPDLAHLLCVDGPKPEAAGFWEEIEAATPIEAAHDTAAEDPAMMIYTSGTTGSPKGVLHAHRFLLGHLPCFEVNHPGIPAEGDVGWTPADWAWIGGLMDLAMPCLWYGIPLVSHRMRKFDAGEAWDLIAAHGVTRMFLPPTAIRRMREREIPEGVDVRSIGSGGESLGADLLSWGERALGADINELYGQTECNLVVASDRSTGRAREGFMGKPLPGHEVAVIDADANPVAPGETGEIAVKRPDPSMFLRYWNQPEKTAAKFQGDWMRTGDLGTPDEDGFIAFVSRDDDVISSAGYRIGPAEIEGCLAGHDAVLMAAVVGLPDPDRGQAITAFVVLAEGVSREGLAEDLIRHVRESLSPHMAPRAVHFRDELPTTATGKVLRRELRDQTG